MKKLSALIGVLLLVFLVACAPASPRVDYMVTTPGVAPAPGIATGESSSGGRGIAQASPPTAITADQQLSADRMIVRTGNMALVVEDVPVAIQRISDMAIGFKGGYVVSSNVFGDKDRLFGSISIRIPAESFDVAIRNLRALAVDVTSETSNSQDVTQEYTDLGAQLKNLEATEQQLLKILEKAEKVEDILAVQRELSNTRGQIEQTKGRMLFLERTSATSLIDISLQQSKMNLDFNSNKTTLKEGEQTFFSADISGGFAPYSYQWDLGDKTTSTEAGLVHSYKNDGKYTVSLTVTDDHGNKVTKTRTDYITVIPGWSAGNIVSSASNGLVGFGRAMASIFIWLGIFSPVWIIGGGIAYGIYYLRRRKGKKTQ